MSRALRIALVVMALGCRHKSPFAVPIPEDNRSRYVRMIEARLDHGEEIFDAQNEEVRDICRRRPDFTDCAKVIPRLPPPPLGLGGKPDDVLRRAREACRRDPQVYVSCPSLLGSEPPAVRGGSGR
jgi:hypothetical protein